jgi:hypothetical protein
VPGVQLVAGEEGGDLGVLFFEPVTHVRCDNARALKGLSEVGLAERIDRKPGSPSRDLGGRQINLSCWPRSAFH